MITNTDLSSINLSPTKKDFYQIWNELLDTAKKISERWDPTSTNESDPGIVLLKVLAAVADTLNYNIDKNILEAFMPSAAQEESMRKLCDMLGYDMKYYQSAMTQIKFTYIGEEELSADGLMIPEFMSITNVDKDVHYLVTDFGRIITNSQKTVTLNCIEGQLVQCESENDNIISINQIDDKFRYYLPETQIAENGIFIYTINDGNRSSIKWTKVNNLNTQSPGAEVYKFGYDSREARPYIQFPADIAQVMEDGLVIYYVRTAGVNGNISARTLSTFEIPTDWKNFDTSMFLITNPDAAKNGSNIETLESAYNNFKKTIGTFDTLVTCRDYMNKIYQLTDDLNNPLVSNIIVSDIRDDINRSYTLCTMNDYGIRYVDKSKIINSEELINHFNLILYPFKTVKGLNTYDEYVKSFTYDPTNNAEIIADIADNKTISHIFDTPKDGDIICIKNYLKLNAKITTINKVNTAEELLILANIKEAIYAAFNMRQLDFGEEIPYESILKVIEQADARIKNVILDEPLLSTKFCTTTAEYETDKTYLSGNETAYFGNIAYNKLALRNILAGRIALFNYNTDFKYSLNEAPAGDKSDYPETGHKIAKLETAFIPTFPIPAAGISLTANEVIKFRFPNLKTTVTYPAYINYYLKLTDPATEIEPGSEYQLEQNEYLLINYMKSEKETEQKTVINLRYPAGTIIKPTGIKLGNSETVHGSDNGRHPWTKTSGYNFDEVPNPSGMFTLGPGEQIEIRDFVQVTLDEPITYLYWKLDKDIDSGTTRTLEDGEYIFYTDTNKTDIAYYGSGTGVTNASGKSIIAAETKDNIDIAEIFEKGVSGIPWKTFNLGQNTYIKLTEYQYKTIAINDTIKSITTNANESTIGNDWKDCSGATWTYADGTPGSLEGNRLTGYSWQYRSLLEFNMGPNITQKLSSLDKLYLYYEGSNNTAADKTLTNTAVKSNIIIQSANDTYYKPALFDIKLLCVNELSTPDSVTFNNLNNYWTNISGKDITTGIQLGAIVPQDSFCLLTVYLSDLGIEENKLSKNIWLENCSGITPTIYNNFSSQAETWSWWSYPAWSSSTVYNKNDIVKYNENTYYCKENNIRGEWDSTKWESLPTTGKYYLKNGINTLKIDANPTTGSGGTFIIKCTGNTDDNSKIVLTLGQLDVVKAPNSQTATSGNKYGLDITNIDYKRVNPNGTVTENDIAKQLLMDIIEIDTTKEFYYNCIIDNSFAIDLNSDNKEKLSSEATWYNYNNINNKFVISEIDADWLDYGITIAKSSKVK